MEAKLNLGLTGEPTDIGTRDASVAAEYRRKLFGGFTQSVCAISHRWWVAGEVIRLIAECQGTCLFERFP